MKSTTEAEEHFKVTALLPFGFAVAQFMVLRVVEHCRAHTEKTTQLLCLNQKFIRVMSGETPVCFSRKLSEL